MMIEEKEITEIRRIRHEISAQFEHDPRKVIAYYRHLEKEYRKSNKCKSDWNRIDRIKGFSG